MASKKLRTKSLVVVSYFFLDISASLANQAVGSESCWSRNVYWGAAGALGNFAFGLTKIYEWKKTEMLLS